MVRQIDKVNSVGKFIHQFVPCHVWQILQQNNTINWKHQIHWCYICDYVDEDIKHRHNFLHSLISVKNLTQYNWRGWLRTNGFMQHTRIEARQRNSFIEHFRLFSIIGSVHHAEGPNTCSFATHKLNSWSSPIYSLKESVIPSALITPMLCAQSTNKQPTCTHTQQCVHNYQ